MNLIIRTDASAEIGMGHVMRCLALAQAWKDAGGHVSLITTAQLKEVMARLQEEGIEVIYLPMAPGSPDDAIQTAVIAHQREALWLVIDGYHFGSDYQRIVKESGVRVMFIDDNGEMEHYWADIVLNQNIYAEGLSYSCGPETELLLGRRYALLRREFLKWQGWRREVPEKAAKFLVTLGGGDSDNLTSKVIQAFRKLGTVNVEVCIVAGPANPHFDKIHKELTSVPFAFRLLPSVDNISELMAWADMTVSGAGSTCWEIAFMGLPNIVLVLAANQKGIAEGLEAEGIVLNLGWHEMVSQTHVLNAFTHLAYDTARRRDMSERGRRLVDGCGAARVTAVLKERAYESNSGR